MSTLKTQDYLCGGKAPADITAEFGIRAKRHPAHPELVHFAYSQFESDMSEQICQECRGLILNEADDWAVVNRGFDKFFNHGELLAAPINWTTARVQEKVDGTLCMLYRYADAWHVATTGTPDAGGRVGALDMTFAQLFWSMFTWQDFSPIDPRNHSLLFELTSPHNRVVVSHLDPRLTLLAIRNTATGDYVPRDQFPARLWVREFPICTLEECIATFDHFSGAEQEGYVVVDGAGNRLKIKHPRYVELHHMKDRTSAKSIIEVVLRGEVPEVLSYFPEFKADFDTCSERIASVCEDVAQAYRPICDIETQKEFAAAALQTPWSGALFQIRAGKAASPLHWLQSQPITKVADILRMPISEVTE